MRRDYTPEQIANAKKFRLSGKVVRTKAASINTRWSKDGKTAYVLKPKGARLSKNSKRIHNGKFRGRVKMSASAFEASMKATLYHARIRHYRALYDLTQKEAQALYRSLHDKDFGATVLKALY